MSIESENKQYDQLHAKYEVRALRLILKEFKRLFSQIPFDNLSLDEKISETIIEMNLALNEKSLEEVLFKIHYSIGLEFGRITGRQFRRENPIQLKAFQPLSNFDKEFQEHLLEYFRIYGGSQIKELTKTAVKAIMVEIRKSAKLGETEDQMRDRIFKRVNKKDFYSWQALRIARTETTIAMNEAQSLSMISSGAEMDKIWISRMDGRERESHHLAHNQKVTESGLFLVGTSKMKFPGDRSHGAPGKEIINCYLPGNFIESNIIGGQKSFYSGKALKIITRRGEFLTVTPNHGILTDKGFIKAKDLNIGDNLICNSVNKYRTIRLIKDYIKKKMFTVENVFSSLDVLWLSKKRLIGTLDFDGDGNSMNRYVDIVYPEVKLINSDESAVIKPFNYFRLEASNFISSFISRFSSFNLLKRPNKSATTCVMSFLHLTFPLLFRHFRPLNCFSLGLASKLNVIRFKEGRNSRSTDNIFLSELIDTNARNVSIDDIIRITEFDFSGHVYDFTSYNGVNIVNNIYTSNCRCRVKYQAKRDGSGRLQFNDEAEIQEAIRNLRQRQGVVFSY